MSYNTQKRYALDPLRPLAHRASHARSCAVRVAGQHRISRNEVLRRVRELCGVDLAAITSSEDLERALATLDRLRLPRAVAIRFTDDTLWLRLADGREARVPLTKLPALLMASPEQRHSFQIKGLGYRIRWNELGKDFLTIQLLVDNLL